MDDADARRGGLFSPEGFRNTRRSAIHVHDTEASSYGSNNSPPSENDSLDSTEEVLDAKRLRALNRMVPAFMVKRMIRSGSQQPSARRRRSMDFDSESDAEEGPLLPGQTRIRRAEYPKDLRDIRGDSESPYSDRSSVAHSPHSRRTPLGRSVHSESDVEGGSQGRRGGYPPGEVIDITESSDDVSESSDEGVDDEEIQAYLDGTEAEDRAGMREESLIDWMLSRTRTVGTSKNPRKGQKSAAGAKRRGGGTSEYKADVTTRGTRKYGAGRQTLLTFDQPQRQKGKGSSRGPRHEGFRFEPASRSADVQGPDNVGRDRVANVRLTLDYGAPGKKIWKHRERERRARVKAQGLYTFVSDGTRLVTGRETTTVSVDLEDEGFHKALAPFSQGRSKAYERPPPAEHQPKVPRKAHVAVKGDPHPRNSDQSEEDIPTHGPARRHDIQGDFDIPFLHSGISFGANTYLGGGRLHELINVISSAVEPPKPFTFAGNGFKLGPHMNAAQLCPLVPDICGRLFEFANGLPSTETAKEWDIALRVFCQLVSWIFSTASEADRTLLQDTCRECILRLVKRVQEVPFSDDSMDATNLSVCWFAVELSARLGFPIQGLPHAITSPLTESLKLLVQHLLKHGLRRTMKPILEGGMDGSADARYTAELWICLFHVLDNCGTEDNQGRNRVHPFWKIVQDVIRSERLPRKSNLEASEDIWRTIFSLCALSQFSIHGMTTATCRLPASWDLVVFALKKIRLVAETHADQALSPSSLNKRDEYIGLVTLRCFHLWDRWHWRLDDASMLFNTLVEIFRSRRFANLRHEPVDFPLFMLRGDWNFLSQYKHADSAFVLFLKLIVQAAGLGENHDTGPRRELLPKVKKLLSLAIPVGSLPFSKRSPPTLHELSMLYNRLGAVAIGIYLDPSLHSSRITHARAYINFLDADDTTRFAVIRGMMYFAILMVKRKIPLDPIVEWIQEIVGALVGEFKAMPKSITEHGTDESEDRRLPSVIARDRLFFSIQVLLGSVRRIVETYAIGPEYPEPALLGERSLQMTPSLVS